MPISNASHYEAVLEDLRAQKRKIETAIQAIEDLMGRPTSSPLSASPSAVQRVHVRAMPAVDAPLVSEDSSEGGSLAGFTLRDAIKRVLARGGPMPIKAIHRTVTEGGRKTSYNSVYNTLMRLKDEGHVAATDGVWRRIVPPTPTTATGA